MTYTLALTLDETTARYGLPNGVGHNVMTPVVTLDGDHIGSGTMTLVCTGKPLDADRAERKFLGDRMCTRCEKWEATDGFRDAHTHAMAMLADAEAGESVADMIASTPGAVIVTATGTTVVDGEGDRADVPMVVRENGVRVMTVPGDVTPGTPGNTDRVQRALDAARERAADGEGDTPVVRPVTADDARDAVRTSKRGAAVARERERLEGVRERRAAVEAHKVTLADRKAERAARKADAPAAPVDVVASLSDNTPSANAERDAARDRQNGTAAQRPGQARAWARITDGKCAVVVPSDVLSAPAAMDADGNVTVTLSGRMHMDSVTAVAQVAGLDAGTMIIPVGKSAGALAPVPGSDADGVNGVCPVCHMAVKLTNSGAVGTHRPDGSTPDAPQLSGREIPAVDVRGEATRDASKLREREAEGDDDTTRAQVARSGKFGAERSGARGVRGSRNMGRIDGVATLPRGASGYAGVEFDNGGTFDLDGKEIPAVGTMSEIDPIKGGPFGTLRESEYAALSQSARRRYRAKIANARAIWEAGREKRQAERAAKGMPRTDMRAARKAAAVGSSRQGHTHSHHLSTAHTDTVVTPLGREPRAGRDVPSDAR